MAAQLVMANIGFTQVSMSVLWKEGRKGGTKGGKEETRQLMIIEYIQCARFIQRNA